MTYLMQSTPTRRPQSPMVRRYGRRRQSLALGDDASCLAQAKADAATLDAKRLDLVKNWHPTGFYTPAEMKQVIQQTFEVLNSALAAIERTRAEIPERDFDGDDFGGAVALDQKRGELQRQMGKDSQQFLGALVQANQQHVDLIDAPGLRRWVLSALLSASSGLMAASLVSCMSPWWFGAALAVKSELDRLWEIAQVIGHALKQVGQTILKVPDALDTLLTVGKWTLIIGAPLYLLSKLSKAKGERSSE